MLASFFVKEDIFIANIKELCMQVYIVLNFTQLLPFHFFPIGTFIVNFLRN